MAPITFTIDVEDHRPGPHAELRFPRITREVVGWLGENGIRGTFFVVGEEAERHPDLVADIAAAGHEVALHGHRHVPVGSLSPAELRADLRKGKELLEQASGTEVVGFRAPQFSLVRDAAWVADELADAGFRYSSSVLPTANPLFGFPGAPIGPFRWSSGLVELPAPLLGRGKVRVPLGGVYFRLLPLAVTRRLLEGPEVGDVPWLYLHPYDFDPGEKFYVVRDANPLFSPLQWVNRKRVRSRVAALLASHPGAPLAERAAALADLQEFRPAA